MTEESRGGYCLGLGAFAFLIAAILAVFFLNQAPAPLPDTAPPDQFSADRALVHTRAIAQEPRPAGSMGQEKTRDYIVNYLKSINVEVIVHTATLGGGHGFQTVEDVLARIPGTAPGKSFMLMAHYDSQKWGPGAADDGSGVVVMLETARAIKAGKPLQNEIIFAFTDGEECGKTAVSAVAEHPWTQNLGVVLNLDVRGTGGPTYCFETGGANDWLIRELARSGAAARTNSIMFDVYRRMPVDSDFTLFRDRGVNGYGIAFIGHMDYYHTANDTPEHLSAASIQNDGDYALPLARHLGSIPLDGIKGGDSVYFNTIGSHLIQYPLSWGRPLAVAAGVFMVLLLLVGLIKKNLRFTGLILGVLAFPIVLAAVFAVTAAPVFVLYKIFGVYLLYNAETYAVALVLLTAAVVLTLNAVFAKKAGVLDLTAGALLWMAPILVALEKYFPLASFAATWPILLSGLGLLILLVRAREGKAPALWIVAAGVFPLAALFLFMPGIQAALEMGTVIVGPLVMLLLALALSMLIPQLSLVTRSGRWAPTLLVGGAIALLGCGMVQNGFSAERPRMVSLIYKLDADANAATWTTTDRELCSWSRQFFPQGLAERKDKDAPYTSAQAPVAKLDLPMAEVVSDETKDGARNVALRLTAPSKPSQVGFKIEAPARVLEMTVNGVKMDPNKADEKGWDFHCGIMPRTGVLDILMKVESPEAVKLTVNETRYSLPDFVELGYTPRPGWVISKTNVIDWFEGGNPNSEVTEVKKTLTI